MPRRTAVTLLACGHWIYGKWASGVEVSCVQCGLAPTTTLESR